MDELVQCAVMCFSCKYNEGCISSHALSGFPEGTSGSLEIDITVTFTQTYRLKNNKLGVFILFLNLIQGCLKQIIRVSVFISLFVFGLFVHKGQIGSYGGEEEEKQQ